jgi:hypothetical protein
VRPSQVYYGFDHVLRVENGSTRLLGSGSQQGCDLIKTAVMDLLVICFLLTTASCMKEACKGVGERETGCWSRGFESASLLRAVSLTDDFAVFAASNVVQPLGLT